MDSLISISIVSNQNSVRTRFKTVLNKEADFQVVGESNSAAEAIEAISKLKPDIVLLDLMMPGGDGLQVLMQIRVKFANLKILILASQLDIEAHCLKEALRCGAMGYVSKACSTQELVDTVRSLGQSSGKPNSFLLNKALLSLPPSEGKILKLWQELPATKPQESSGAIASDKNYPQGEIVKVEPDVRGEKDLKLSYRRSPKYSRGLIYFIVASTIFGFVWAKITSLDLVVPASGTILPSNKINKIQVPIGGVVSSIAVEEGDWVKRGDVLFSLDDGKLRSALSSLVEVRASVEGEIAFYRQVLNGGSIDPKKVLNLDGAVVAIGKQRQFLVDDNLKLKGLIENDRSIVPRTLLLAYDNFTISLAENKSISRLDVEQKQTKHNSLKLEIQGDRNLLDLLKESFERINQTNQQAIDAARSSYDLEVKTLQKLQAAFDKGSAALLQVERQKLTVNDRLLQLKRKNKERLLDYNDNKSKIDTLTAQIATKTKKLEELLLEIEQAKINFKNIDTFNRKKLLDRIGRNKIEIAEIDSKFNQSLLRLSKQLAQLDSQIAKAREELNYATVYAPISGTIFDLQIDPGAVVSALSNPVSVVPNGELIAITYVSPKDIGFIAPGAKSDVIITAFEDLHQQGIPGKVVSISSSALAPDSTNRKSRYEVKVALERNWLEVNRQKKYLQTGMEVRANLLVRDDRSVLDFFAKKFFR